MPVDVLTARESARTGAVAGELGQALQSLAPSFNFPRQSNSGGADHVRAAQLRGMSPDQVLVLVNGKRRHTSAIVNLEAKIGKGTTPVDFNSIPLNAIKRIEVLRDGAGAQYGSDAIAGVINVILDDSASGGEASLSYGQNRTSFEPTGQSLRDGGTTVAQLKHGFALGGGFLDVGAEFRHRGSTNRAGFDGGGFFISDSETPANDATLGQRNFAPGDGDAKDKDLWYNAARCHWRAAPSFIPSRPMIIAIRWVRPSSATPTAPATRLRSTRTVIARRPPASTRICRSSAA